ncbi:MAG: efflux RND transporter periplasmic adaptor subunit [Victivallales bacterium]|nr:efflux RND transporter periplasmic adaptor subunit [Victivallales bacterium]
MGDIRVTTGEEVPLPRAESTRRRRIVILIVLLVLIAIVATGIFIKVDRYTVASGYVTTREYAEVRPPVNGIVSEIKVHTGQNVKAGDLLVQLNNEEEEASLAEAKARHAKLKVELERRKAEMDIDIERRSVDLAEQKRSHKDELEIASLQLQNAQTKLKLTKELVAKGLKAETNLEDDMLTEQLAQVRLSSLKKKDFSVYEKLLSLDKAKYAVEIAAINNELSALADAVRRAEARLRTRQVRAPISGMVIRYEFVIGELIQPSTVIYEIFGGSENTLKLRVNEAHSTKVAEGNKYRARLASYHGIQRHYFRGEVSHLRNVIQVDGNSTYRVAYCTFDAGANEIPPGTTAEARIYYGRSCLWLYLFNIDF